MKVLAQKAPGNPQSLLAVTRAAMDANEFGFARNVIAPLVGEPTQRVCLLMAEIESAEHGDHGKAREWTVRAVRARRDPAWVADGYVSDRWLPISPVSGRLDAFVWTAPPETIAGPVLEQVAQQALAAVKSQASVTKPAATAFEKPATSARTPQPAETSEGSRISRRRPAPVVAEPPLPDDPGPEMDAEAVPERPRFRLFQW
jgi:HemY protein